MQKYNSRNDVPEKYKWDLTPFFKDDKEFDESLEKVSKMVDSLKDYVGCTSDAKKLYEFLVKQYEAIALWEDLYVYSYLINDQELGINENIARKNKAELLGVALSTNVSFFAPELLSLSKDKYQKLFEDNIKLGEFKFTLDAIYRDKDHILTTSEEIIVNELTNSMNHFDDISSTLLNKEHDYGKIKMDDGSVSVIATNNYYSLMKDKNVNVRKRIYNSFWKKIDQYGSTSASLLNSYVSMQEAIAKIRHYDDSWSSKLIDLNLNNIVFENLVNTTENNLNSLHRYYNLKKHVLGLDCLHMYDLSLDMTSCNREYSIEEAQEIVRNAIKPLGKEYADKLEKIFKNRYIDYCQYKGKCSGGYSFSTLLHDSRILLSYNGNLDSVSTIAHESGHNVHHQFVLENNPLQYREPTSLVAEVVSLTNECLLSSYIVNNANSKEEKLAGLENILSVFVSNLFGSVREGKIEQEMYNEVHNGGTITKEFMDEKVKKSIKKYYGKSVKLDKYAKNSWVRRSHYYMHFYLYSYAICISVASNVASKILEGDDKMLTNYIKFLCVGSDKWPSEAFSVLGIDLEDKNVYLNAIKYFDSLIDKYYEILGETEVM